MNAGKYFAGALLLLLALLSGCASYPISKEFRRQAQYITLDQVKSDPMGTRGKIVIWGGRIINVVNQTNGSAIYIVCLPMPPNERPLAGGPSPGRFIATGAGFLDPEMFPHGNLITVAGQLDGVSVQPLGNMPYAYPVLDIQETHVWPKEPEGYYYPYYGGWYGPGWGWGWGPGWWWWGGGFYPYYYGGYYYGGYGGYYGGGYHGVHGSGGGGFHGGGTGGGGGEHGGGGGGGFSGGGGGGGGGSHGR